LYRPVSDFNLFFDLELSPITAFKEKKTLYRSSSAQFKNKDHKEQQDYILLAKDSRNDSTPGCAPSATRGASSAQPVILYWTAIESL
jgi:hypothetical protein